jgi:site-specific DNA-methyltransferase (adenine-specific)
MENRLNLAREFLSDDGVIFVSIDDNEQDNLKKLMDEVFGSENFVGRIAWESKTKSQNTKDAYRKLQPRTENIFVYFRNQKINFNLIVK